jgi:hypothetical protein
VIHLLTTIHKLIIMKKTFLIAAAFSVSLLAVSCGNDTDSMSGGTTDTTTMSPAPAGAATDNTDSGVANTNDSAAINGGGMQSGGSGSAGGSGTSGGGTQSTTGTSGAGNNGTTGGSSQSGGRQGNTGSDSTNNRTGLGQSK